MKYTFLLFCLFLMFNCTSVDKSESESREIVTAPFLWENASVYFILTDRFKNGDPGNDFSFNRKQDGAKLRSFSGGDLRGIIQKIDAGYFDKLGINAIWITPPIEQIHGFTNEGTGKTYGFHGYWAKDWTNVDPNYGTMADLKEMVDKAHLHGIRILLDVVANHTGPVTNIDEQWPDEWVRVNPVCAHKDYETSVPCALVKNLPDIRTESNEAVELPEFLIEKWQQEGRLDQEIQEIDAFFTRTGHPRAPRFYIIKWLSDYVRELGIDGFRVDTAKHTEASVWQELYNEVSEALKEWKNKNQDKKLDDLPFFMVGEVYGYGVQGGLYYNYGDTSVNFYDSGLQGLINFSFKSDAQKSPEEIFSQYASILNSELSGKMIMNYISSHDDSGPFDLNREKPFESASKLLLAPGAAQIYYGDESARSLNVEGTQGDAHLRSEMNWEELDNNANRGEYSIGDVYEHWAKLANFRKEHPAIGAGIHIMINEFPYSFRRTLNREGYTDAVMVVMGEVSGSLDVSKVFEDNIEIKDYYSGEIYHVKDGSIHIVSDNNLILLGKQE